MRRTFALAPVLAAASAGAGCVHTGHHHAGPAIAVPPPGAVPRELDKVTLPPYVIEAPDELLIEVVQIKPALDEKGEPRKPEELIPYAVPVQPVSGQFRVRPDGSVYLGIWGGVTVAGLTLEQAAAAVRDHLGRQPDPSSKTGERLNTANMRIVLDVLQYNSKRYYVVTDGGGNGEQVAAFPVTGSETVFDALANIGGLPAVASKRNIWVARRTPHAGQPEQILPVDWVGITQHGVTATNYQLMPGDRVYVKAQRLVTLDTALARLLTPIERVFGVTLLGANTVNQVGGRGTGFNNQGQ